MKMFTAEAYASRKMTATHRYTFTPIITAAAATHASAASIKVIYYLFIADLHCCAYFATNYIGYRRQFQHGAPYATKPPPVAVIVLATRSRYFRLILAGDNLRCFRDTGAELAIWYIEIQLFTQFHHISTPHTTILIHFADLEAAGELTESFKEDIIILIFEKFLDFVMMRICR